MWRTWVVLLAAAAAAKGASNDLVLSFSGGGARAALGSMAALMWLEEANGLEGVSSVNGLSGGSWGTVMFALSRFGEESVQAIKDKAGLQFPEHRWAELKSFSRVTAVRARYTESGMRDVYSQWLRDVDERVFMRNLSFSWDQLAKEVGEKYSFPLCSFFSEGDRESPDSTCKWCTGQRYAECFRTDGTGRRSVDLLQPLEVAFTPRPHGFSTADVMGVTSSAWTFVSREIPVRLGQGEHLRLSDAGIDCNLPFDPQWLARPADDERKRVVVIFDFSDNSGLLTDTPGRTLGRCVGKWNSRYKLKLSVAELSASSTRVNEDGTMASPEERRAHKGKSEHRVESAVREVLTNDPALGFVRIYWVQFRNMESSTELMSKHKTQFLGWPYSYDRDKVEDIQNAYRRFLKAHVWTFLRRELSTSFSTVGIARLFDEGE